MIELTDTELDQVHGGVGTGVGTAYQAQGGPEPRVRDAFVVPADHANVGIGRSTAQTGIFPTGHGTITANSAQNR